MASIEDQIKKLLKDKKVLAKARFDDGRSLVEVLNEEANNLKNMVADEIRNYYSSYTPVVYQRDDSRSLDKMLRIEANKTDNTISIYFDNSMAWRESVFPNSESGYTPLLIDQGWIVKKDVWFKTKPHFGYYKGYGFIEKAVNRFRKTNPYNLNVKVVGEYGGKNINVYDNI